MIPFVLLLLKIITNISWVALSISLMRTEWEISASAKLYIYIDIFVQQLNILHVLRLSFDVCIYLTTYVCVILQETIRDHNEFIRYTHCLANRFISWLVSSTWAT